MTRDIESAAIRSTIDSKSCNCFVELVVAWVWKSIKTGKAAFLVLKRIIRLPVSIIASRVYALTQCYVQDTPQSLFSPGDLECFFGALAET